VDTLYTVGFKEVSRLYSFKNFKNLTTGCKDIAYCLVWYFILSHPVEQTIHPFFNIQQSKSHTRTLVRECFKGDEASQWKRPKLDPLPHQNPLTDLPKNWRA